MPTIEQLLDCTAGLVEAPAGCGKTELLAQSVKAHSGRRILVLTHTRAGAWALNKRLGRAATSGAARVSTLDGWALWLLSRYPATSGFVRHDGRAVWSEARAVVTVLLGDAAVRRRIAATYSRVLVDEYQDCTEAQHGMIVALADILPTVVVGDPMQRIFGFGGERLPTWASVQAAFPLLGTLSTPWRWNKHGEEGFGRWTLQQREMLRSGCPVDLTTAPPNVEFIEEPHGERARAEVRRTAIPVPGLGGLLIITAAMQVAERRLAARTGVQLAVVEPYPSGE